MTCCAEDKRVCILVERGEEMFALHNVHGER
jgi:hypothetical protein